MINAGEFLDKVIFKGKTPQAGDYIRAQRKILNLILDDLEQITGIDKANLSSYENNKKEIGVKVAVKIGVGINLDPHILLESSIRSFLAENEISEIKSKSKKFIKLKSKSVA
jgi:transcriptional regulator with XRE-family HTH domain